MRSAILFSFFFAGCASGGGGDGDADADVDTDADTDTGVDCPEPLVCGPETSLDCFCRGDCVDTLTNDHNCGACFLNCSVEDGRASGCVDGECVCGDSQTLCGGSLDDFCCPVGGVAACVDQLTDEANCGACGNVCGMPGSSMCRSGQCVCGVPDDPDIDPAPCAAPQVCCGEGAAATCQPAGSC